MKKRYIKPLMDVSVLSSFENILTISGGTTASGNIGNGGLTSANPSVDPDAKKEEWSDIWK